MDKRPTMEESMKHLKIQLEKKGSHEVILIDDKHRKNIGQWMNERRERETAVSALLNGGMIDRPLALYAYRTFMLIEKKRPVREIE